MSEVLERLFHNRYTQAFDALLLLAAYRLSALLEWWQWIVAFVLIPCVDGYLVRLIRSKEFLEHSPMRFALGAIGATLALAFALLLLWYRCPSTRCCSDWSRSLSGLAMAISHFHP